VTSRARLALAMMVLLALIAVVYAPVRKGAFIWDDHALIETSRVVEHGSLLEIFGRPYWTAHSLGDVLPSYYRPLTTLTLRADYAMAGPDARSFHVSNLLMHLLATIALVLTARRLGAGPVASVLAATAWALHPRSTEAVAWVSGRTDLLAGLMSLVAVGAWPWYSPSDVETKGERAWAAAAGAAVLAGLLAKEVAVAAALAIGVGTAFGTLGRGRGAWLLAVRRLAWVGAPLVVYAGLRLMATRGTHTSRLAPLGFELRAATVLEAVGRYVAMTFDPWHPATNIGLVGEIDPGSVVLGLLALAFFAALIVRAIARRLRASASASASASAEAPARRAVMASLLALGLTSLALVLHVVPIGLASGVAADRLLYLPLAALAVAAAVASSRLGRPGKTALAALAAALAATFVPVTRARATDYTDELRFRVVAAEQAHPHSTSAKSGLANMLRADAETRLACELHASVQKTLERMGKPKSQRYLRALENLGGCYAALGAYDDAERTYALLERLEPKHARVHMELGFLGLHTFDLARAEVEFQRALELDAGLGPARASLAALPELRLALQRFASADARRAYPVEWARLLTSLGRIPDATVAWTSIVMDPNVDGSVAWPGLEHLLANADIETAKRTATAGIARHVFAKEVVEQRLAKRLRRQASIDALRPRIEALAHPAP
jgi:protein O-mannosyl-transferase